MFSVNKIGPFEFCACRRLFKVSFLAAKMANSEISNRPSELPFSLQRVLTNLRATVHKLNGFLLVKTTEIVIR